MGKISFEDVYNIYIKMGRGANKVILKSDSRYIPTKSGVYIVRPPKGFNIEFMECPDGTKSVNGKFIGNRYQDVLENMRH